ncbi:hypothetical protein [Microbacterium sp. SS28]|uniref:hypothetical protein n=1 Tax=Microbacterium sp. SS28 TaxID=2919948 RepID=UPI001FA98BEC|nr:hypothetical protein [Microbacterium sp. SS28]
MTDAAKRAASGKRPAYEPARELLRRPGYRPEMTRPPTTVAGAVLVFLRVVVGVLWLGELALNWNVVATETSIDLEGFTSDEAVGVGLWIVVGIASVILVLDIVLGVLILRGLNWPRVVVMLFAVISICSAFTAWWLDDLEITLTTSLLTTALDTLILLALSSRSAAAYARRNERR